mgnify:CR=1 FL=1
MKDKHKVKIVNISEDDSYLSIEKEINGFKIISHFPKYHPDSERNFNEFKRLLNAPVPQK